MDDRKLMSGTKKLDHNREKTKEINCMKTRLKRVGTVVLSLIMILGIMPAVTTPMEVQAANSAPAKAYWTEASSLKTGYNLNGGKKAKSNKN